MVQRSLRTRWLSGPLLRWLALIVLRLWTCGITPIIDWHAGQYVSRSLTGYLLCFILQVFLFSAVILCIVEQLHFLKARNRFLIKFLKLLPLLIIIIGWRGALILRGWIVLVSEPENSAQNKNEIYRLWSVELKFGIFRCKDLCLFSIIVELHFNLHVLLIVSIN